MQMRTTHNHGHRSDPIPLAKARDEASSCRPEIGKKSSSAVQKRNANERRANETKRKLLAIVEWLVTKVAARRENI